MNGLRIIQVDGIKQKLTQRGSLPCAGVLGVPVKCCNEKKHVPGRHAEGLSVWLEGVIRAADACVDGYIDPICIHTLLVCV